MLDLITYAMLFIGTPYCWGGNDIETGVDCSGFVQEVLSAFGHDPRGDQTAQGLYNYFNSGVRSVNAEIKRNSLLFFGKDENKITHIAIAIDSKLMIESGGEGSVDTTHGMVRIRPIKNRHDLVGIVPL